MKVLLRVFVLGCLILTQTLAQAPPKDPSKDPLKVAPNTKLTNKSPSTITPNARLLMFISMTPGLLSSSTRIFRMVTYRERR
jgi:hypothetical protein